jgi:hypothetical protein
MTLKVVWNNGVPASRGKLVGQQLVVKRQTKAIWKYENGPS